MKKLFSLILMLFFLAGKSQLPETDIWLFKLEKDKQKKSIITEGLNLTKRAGYDNQPSFSKDARSMYYVSIREDKQADIFVYDLKHQKEKKLTSTIESEYSPLLTPRENFLSSVVVEKDSSQKIHLIDPITGIHNYSYDFDSVGYYNYVNEDTLIYYKLTDPHSLRFHVKSSGEDKFICSSPVRSIKTINRHRFIFGIKDSVKVTFYQYDFFLRKAEKYTEYNSLAEDFIWHPTLGLIKSEGVKLLRYDEKSKSWNELYDLSSFGLKKITRFSFDKNDKQLIVVENQ